MKISKEDRLKVYSKYGGRCAYCGKDIEYEDMQIDHLIPQCRAEDGKVSWDEVNSFSNLMPSCRQCNHYKRANSLEQFRNALETIPTKLYRDNYIYRMGSLYNMWGKNPSKRIPIVFYFENESIKQIPGQISMQELIKENKNGI